MATPVTLYDLLPDVLSRIEEDLPPAFNSPPTPPNPDGAPDGPIFWNLMGEVYVQMVDAIFEAAMATGLVQLSNVQVTLAANTTYFALQNNTSIGIPKGVIAAMRMRAPFSIRKTTLKALDDYQPAWQQTTPGSQIISWFPLGLSYFGIYPQQAADSQVVMDFIYSPINQTRPYDGTQVVPLQQEFNDILTQYAAAMLRSKEGGAEAEEADVVFQAFATRMKKLSAFQMRMDSLDYSPAFGAAARVNPREVV